MTVDRGGTLQQRWRWWRRCAHGVVVTVLLTLVGAQAKADPAKDTPPPETSTPEVLDGHAWLTFLDITPAKNRIPERRSTMLVHVPPRIGAGIAGRKAVDEGHGVVRYAPEIAGEIDALSWESAQVWVLWNERNRSGRGPARDVGRIDAIRTSLGGYAYEPGRFELGPPLWGDVDVLGFAATPVGPVALVRQRDKLPEESVQSPERVGRPGEIMLRLLLQGSWRECAPPASVRQDFESGLPLEEARTRFSLLRARDGFSLVVRSGSELRMLDANVLSERREYGPPGVLEWSERTLSATDHRTGETIGLSEIVFVKGGAPSDDAVIGVQRLESGLRLHALRPSGASEIAAFDDLPDDVRVAGLDAPRIPGAPGGMILLYWGTPAPIASKSNAESGRGAPQLKPEPLKLREVSVRTGRVLYDGPARNTGLISDTEFRILAGLLLLVMASVIVYVVRVDTTRGTDLPEGLELADPIRRVLAGGIDYVVGGVGAALVLGLPALSLIRPSEIVELESVRGVLLALGLTALHCAIGEWRTGQSIGKGLLGIRVIVLDGAAPDEIRVHRPGIAAALSRNLVRWGLPIVGLLMLLDQSRRHPGDVLGRTLVVQDAPEDPPEEA